MNVKEGDKTKEFKKLLIEIAEFRANEVVE